MKPNTGAQKQGGETFQPSRHMLEALFESFPEALLISDGNDCIVQVNIEVETLFGYSQEELRGQPYQDAASGTVP
jgi:PAS domain S-box-containing protein